jgi:hypothetical protein
MVHSSIWSLGKIEWKAGLGWNTAKTLLLHLSFHLDLLKLGPRTVISAAFYW